MQAIERVQAARVANRPGSRVFIEAMIDGFMPMRGDRLFGDDPAILCGLGWLNDLAVTVVGIDKGQDIKSRLHNNFGSAHPEGYRKALRQFRLAEKFGRPVITLIDTSGAFCGLGAEERGQGLAIAENLRTLMGLKVPVIAILTGEGGSGGALGLAVADRVWMLENAVYSVISPEGCASILWKDAGRVAEAADCLKLTAEDLLSFKVMERVFPEDQGFEALSNQLKTALYEELQTLLTLPTHDLLAQRYDRFRQIPGGLS